jgi:hypothetical protein
MEKDAAQKGFSQMETESTLTAETFYKLKGYQEVERKRRKIARGEMLEVVALKKTLHLTGKGGRQAALAIRRKESNGRFAS